MTTRRLRSEQEGRVGGGTSTLSNEFVNSWTRTFTNVHQARIETSAQFLAQAEMKPNRRLSLFPLYSKGVQAEKYRYLSNMRKFLNGDLE